MTVLEGALIAAIEEALDLVDAEDVDGAVVVLQDALDAGPDRALPPALAVLREKLARVMS